MQDCRGPFAAARHLRRGREGVQGGEHEQPDQRDREQRGDGLQPPSGVEDAVGRHGHGNQRIGRRSDQDEASVAVDLPEDAPTEPTGLLLARKDVAELELLGGVVRCSPGRVRRREAHGRGQVVGGREVSAASPCDDLVLAVGGGVAGVEV